MRKIRRLDHWVASGAMTVDARIQDLTEQLSDLQRVRTALGKILEIVGDGTVPEPEPKLKEQGLITNGTLDIRKKARRRTKRPTAIIQAHIIKTMREQKEATVREVRGRSGVSESVIRRHLDALIGQGIVSKSGAMYRWTGK